MNLDLDKLEQVASEIEHGLWGYGGKAYSDEGGYYYNVTNEIGDDVLGEYGVDEKEARYIAAACPAVVLELVRRLRAAEARAYPETLTPPLAHVLGFLNFRTGPMAHLFRAAGHDIRTKCEDEQAFVLDRMVRTVIEHGENWADVFAEDLRKADDIRKSKAAAQGASHD